MSCVVQLVLFRRWSNRSTSGQIVSATSLKSRPFLAHFETFWKDTYSWGWCQRSRWASQSVDLTVSYMFIRSLVAGLPLIVTGYHPVWLHWLDIWHAVVTRVNLYCIQTDMLFAAALYNWGNSKFWLHLCFLYLYYIFLAYTYTASSCTWRHSEN